MKREMTLMELQDVLGQRVRMVLNDELTPEQRKEENAQSMLIMGIAKQMINNADIVMRAENLQAKARDLNLSRINDMIGE